MKGSATLSPCGQYRYVLWRSWRFANGELEGQDIIQDEPVISPTGPFDGDRYVMFICLNPSTATGTVNDQTVTRCVGFARSWGYMSMCITNLYAFRSTDPAALWGAYNPIGIHNDQWIKVCGASASQIAVAWGGSDGPMPGRGMAVRAFFQHAYCIKKLQNGNPMHPSRAPAIPALNISWP